MPLNVRQIGYMIYMLITLNGVDKK